MKWIQYGKRVNWRSVYSRLKKRDLMPGLNPRSVKYLFSSLAVAVTGMQIGSGRLNKRDNYIVACSERPPGLGYNGVPPLHVQVHTVLDGDISPISLALLCITATELSAISKELQKSSAELEFHVLGVYTYSRLVQKEGATPYVPPLIGTLTWV